jgi:GMP synthase (glutamine-hydrolysing)
MSHGDTIARIADNFEVIASTDSVKVAAYQVTGTQTYGIQFHPEVTHSIDGKQLLENFLVDICGCSQDWTPDSFIETTIAELKAKAGR